MIILLIPIISMLVAGFVMFLAWGNAIDSADDVVAPRYIRPSIKEILESETVPDFNGILMLLDNNGNIIYASEEAKEMIQGRDGKDFLEIYTEIIQDIPSDTIGLTAYKYKETTGLAVFLQADFPVLKFSSMALNMILLTYLIFILLPAITLNFFMRPMHKSLLRMEAATIKIGKGQWDAPLIVGKENRGVGRLEKAFYEMQLQLKENHDRNSRILMSISHDLKTPLTSILGYVEALNDDMATNPEDLKHYTEIIGDKAKLLEERISDLIHFARLQTSDWQSRFANFNMFDFLENSRSIFKNDALIRKRIFSSELNISKDMNIKGDEKMLYTVLENIFDNSCRYSNEDDTISLISFVEDNNIVILIEDSGPGVAKEHEEHIFENFYRADQGRNSRGIGVGLASSKTIIQSHNGKLKYFTSELGGAGFKIELPLENS